MKLLFPLRRTLVPVFLLLFAASQYAQQGPLAGFNPPKQYYLALGDSLAFGMQRAKFNANLPSVPPSVFNTGYVDDFGAQLRTIRSDLQTVNFGCPGETSLTFINGGCDYTSRGFSLHNSYTGAQLSAAIAFLQEHPGQVSPITINLGVNDLNPLQSTCGLDVPCYLERAPAILAATKANLDQILGAIRTAAPDAEIITFTNYDIPGVLLDPRLGRIAEAFNDIVSDTARSHSVKVADVFSAFNAGPQPATICSLTLFCTPLQDTHPSDAGYATIAARIGAQAGTAAGPTITKAFRDGKHLIIVGSGFQDGAKALRNGEGLKTRVDSNTQLFCKKQGKSSVAGDQIQVRNPDGSVSNVVTYPFNPPPES